MPAAAESIAELRLAAAWPALRGVMPACTMTLASPLMVVPEPESVSARAAVPTEPAAMQRPATTAPSWRRRRAGRDVRIDGSFPARWPEAGSERRSGGELPGERNGDAGFLRSAEEFFSGTRQGVRFARNCPD